MDRKTDGRGFAGWAAFGLAVSLLSLAAPSAWVQNDIKSAPAIKYNQKPVSDDIKTAIANKEKDSVSVGKRQEAVKELGMLHHDYAFDAARHLDKTIKDPIMNVRLLSILSISQLRNTLFGMSGVQNKPKSEDQEKASKLNSMLREDLEKVMNDTEENIYLRDRAAEVLGSELPSVTAKNERDARRQIDPSKTEESGWQVQPGGWNQYVKTYKDYDGNWASHVILQYKKNKLGSNWFKVFVSKKDDGTPHGNPDGYYEKEYSGDTVPSDNGPFPPQHRY